MKLTKKNVHNFIGKQITFTANGHNANGRYSGTAVIKDVDLSKSHPIICEIISGDNLKYAFIDMDGESFTYSDNDRPIEVYEGLEARLSALGNGCTIEVEGSAPDNEGNLVLFCADGSIHAAAYLYNDGTLFHLRDWQGGRPESTCEIEDFTWLSEGGLEAVSLNGRPRLLQ